MKFKADVTNRICKYAITFHMICALRDAMRSKVFYFFFIQLVVHSLNVPIIIYSVNKYENKYIFHSPEVQEQFTKYL